jgi:hypothetical protein
LNSFLTMLFFLPPSFCILQMNKYKQLQSITMNIFAAFRALLWGKTEAAGERDTKIQIEAGVEECETNVEMMVDEFPVSDEQAPEDALSSHTMNTMEEEASIPDSVLMSQEVAAAAFLEEWGENTIAMNHSVAPLYEEKSKKWWENYRERQSKKRGEKCGPIAAIDSQPEDHQVAIRNVGRRLGVLHPHAPRRGGYTVVKLRRGTFEHPNGKELKAYSCVPSVNVESSAVHVYHQGSKVTFSDSPSVIPIPSWNRFNRHNEMRDAFHSSHDKKHWKVSRKRIEDDLDEEELKSKFAKKYLKDVISQIPTSPLDALVYRGVSAKAYDVGNVAEGMPAGSVTDCFGRRRSSRLSQAAQTKAPKRVYNRKIVPEFGSVTDGSGRRRSARLQKRS